MSEQNINATQMMWQPPLLKLTQIGLDGVDDGIPTTLYINPALIQKISRAKMWFTKPDGTKSDAVMATELHCCHFVCHVSQDPEFVALMRDKALGHDNPLKAVSS